MNYYGENLIVCECMHYIDTRDGGDDNMWVKCMNDIFVYYYFPYTHRKVNYCTMLSIVIRRLYAETRNISKNKMIIIIIDYTVLILEIFARI